MLQFLFALFKANNKELPGKTEDYTPEMIIRRAESTRTLLNSWQIVPGVQENGEIDSEYLRKLSTRIGHAGAN